MTSLPDNKKESRLKILDDLMYAKPVNKDLQIVDVILTKMLRGSDKKRRDELWKLLYRWQFRVEIADALHEVEENPNTASDPSQKARFEAL